MTRLALVLVCVMVPVMAKADPCVAISDAGKPPPYVYRGSVFTGPVVYVGDGDSLCVAAVRGRETDPQTWVEVRLADFNAPELSEPGGVAAREATRRLISGKNITCQVEKARGKRAFSYDRANSYCTLNGSGLGDLLRRSGVREGGR